MVIDPNSIDFRLRGILKSHVPLLSIRKDSPKEFEVCGTKEVMQGKQKVDGHYFASLIPKSKDVRLYFFPIYTHADAFTLSEELKKCLKGKSCFHIKKLSPELETEISEMVKTGVELYDADGLI